ncbi:hypothetical protein B0H19DRAFT_1061605 [Mycena capillaripes]|nr:hypothetical protein B0H19DRAFT_1061605 [Mycena capillaripes]
MASKITMLPTKSLPSTDGPVTLHFEDITRVAGETIHGRVELNVALAQKDNLEHLRIKFRGTIQTHISTADGKTTTIDYYATVVLVDTNLLLWDQEATYSEPDSHVLSFPFQFQFPDNLPPSFHHSTSYSAEPCHANISYSLEVLGHRTRFFRLNRRIRRLISVVPAASQEQLLAKEVLRQGWNGPWRDITHEEKLRRGIWGDYSHARVKAGFPTVDTSQLLSHLFSKLTIPALDSFPTATDIPFSFHIETDTKPMHISGSPVDKHGKPLFPAPPDLSSDVKLFLRRRVEIRVHPRTRQVQDIYTLKGSLGDTKRVAAVRQVTDEPEWIPATGAEDKKGHGIWRRAVHFESAVAIPCAPTTNTENLDWKYDLWFIVPFPGMLNNLKLDVPIRLDPGSPCPPPPVEGPGSSNMTYADVLPAGPPPVMLDLPPSYWAGENYAWDSDEKS